MESWERGIGFLEARLWLPETCCKVSKSFAWLAKVLGYIKVYQVPTRRKLFGSPSHCYHRAASNGVPKSNWVPICQNSILSCERLLVYIWAHSTGIIMFFLLFWILFKLLYAHFFIFIRKWSTLYWIFYLNLMLTIFSQYMIIPTMVIKYYWLPVGPLLREAGAALPVAPEAWTSRRRSMAPVRALLWWSDEEWAAVEFEWWWWWWQLTDTPVENIILSVQSFTL